VLQPGPGYCPGRLLQIGLQDLTKVVVRAFICRAKDDLQALTVGATPNPLPELDLRKINTSKN
jgi:hypothetical protein